MAEQRLDEAALAEFLFTVIEGFRDAIGIKGQDVARVQSVLHHRTGKMVEESNDRAGGVEALHGSISPQDEPWQMTAVGIAQTAGARVEVGEEERRIGIVGGILKQQAVDGTQKPL